MLVRAFVVFLIKSFIWINDMKDERIRAFMIEIGFEHSNSLKSTLDRLINEVDYETRRECARIIENGGTHKDLVWGNR